MAAAFAAALLGAVGAEVLVDGRAATTGSAGDALAPAPGPTTGAAPSSAPAPPPSLAPAPPSPPPVDASPAAPLTPDPAAGTVTTYRVRPGDTVGEIADLHAVAVGDLVAHNGLSEPSSVVPGQPLAVPPPSEPPTGGLPAATEAPDGLAVRRAVERWAPAHGVPTDLLAAVLWRESSWRAGARSDAGAVGVGQLLPDTARWVADDLIGEPLDPAVLDDNVRLSSRLLGWLIDRAAGDQAAAVAAYYQGSAATERDGWYDDTAAYVASVFRWRWRFSAA